MHDGRGKAKALPYLQIRQFVSEIAGIHFYRTKIMVILYSTTKRTFFTIFLPFILAYFASYPPVSSFVLDAGDADRLLTFVQYQANPNASTVSYEGDGRGGRSQSPGYLPGFELLPQTKDTPIAKTGATPRRIPGSMIFRHEMAGLLGEKVGPDNSGDIYHAGGLAGYYTGTKELFPGKGEFGHLYTFLPVIRWYDPAHYFNTNGFHPGSPVNGEFTNEQCVACHNAENPGIVAQWKQSKHGTPPAGKEVVGCDRCHGKNHEKLTMPSCDLCGECHEKQLKGHREGGRGSHAHAYHLELVDQGCQMEKPAEETAACLACHAIAENRCDGCHTRHRFSAAEARRPTS